MKKTTLFYLLTMLLFFAGSNVWADEEPFYTLWTVSNTEGSNHTNYTQYFDDEHDGMIWNAPGNQGVSKEITDRWRIGGKELDHVDRTITAKTPMGSAINRVVLNHFGVSRDQVTINSLKLTVASDVEYTTIIDEVELTPTIGKGEAGSVEFMPVATTGPEWPISAYYRLTINVSNTSTSNGGLDVASIMFYAPTGTVTVRKPVITPNGGTFTEPQTVTITADEGCDIYYTTDGTDPAPTHGKYTAPFTVSENCTVKAVAYDVTGASSSIASAEFKFNTGAAIATIAELCAAEQGSVTVLFNNWICTGLRGKNNVNVLFTDGENGILLYQSDHGFKVGDHLRGTATVNLTAYKGAPEITGLTATTEGVTVTAGETVAPTVTTIGSLDNTKQGCVVKLEALTYNATDKVLTDATGASIAYYDGFGTGFTPEDGKTYDATGIVLWYEKLQIAPRTAEDFVEAGTVVVVAKPVITPNGGMFAEPQTVTITAGEGCTIYYTTDGTEPGITPVAAGPRGTEYTAPFTVSEDCTVKAVAIDATGASSAVAEATFTFGAAIPSIARLCAAATATEQTVPVSINNWTVTGVNGGQVFLTDGANGIVLYEKNHGFELGDVLNGEASVSLVIFTKNDFSYPEIMGLTATTEGVTVTKGTGTELTPQVVVVSDLNTDLIDQQGNLIRLEGVTYSDGKFIDSDDNPITPYNTFKIDGYPTLLEGQTYNVTGVAIWFGYWEIAPRTAAEFELVTNKQTPESSWSVEEEVVDITGTPTAVFTTNSDGAITYESSDEGVATIDEKGVITLVGKGITTITATVAETDNYLPDSKSFKLTVTQDGYADATFVYNDDDIKGQGAPDTGAELTAIRNDVLTLYANKAYAKPGDTHIKIYGSKYDGKDEEKVLTEPSYIQLSVVDGYSIVKIVLTATGEGYIKEWTDQFGTSATIDGVTATWEGDKTNVILTNLATAQARIKTIAVTYIDTSKVDAISTPTSVEGETAIYNLAGQRLSKMQKGINIVGGKKILK